MPTYSSHIDSEKTNSKDQTVNKPDVLEDHQLKEETTMALG